MDSFAREIATINVIGRGLESISCLEKSAFQQKFGRISQKTCAITWNDVQFSSFRYCSIRNETHAAVVMSFVSLLRTPCRSIGAMSCAAPFNYTGSKLGETVNLKEHTFASESGIHAHRVRRLMATVLSGQFCTGAQGIVRPVITPSPLRSLLSGCYRKKSERGETDEEKGKGNVKVKKKQSNETKRNKTRRNEKKRKEKKRK